MQKSWSINHEGETHWKGVVFSSFPRLKSRTIFVRAHTDAVKCSAPCKPSKFIFANKCSVTVEISDWSAEAGKRGKARQGNAKREITANRMRKRRRAVRKGLRASPSRYFRIFLCARRRSPAGGERPARRIAMRFYELFHIRERSVIRANFEATVQLERLQ